MPWIESHTVISRHRKLHGLARDLRLNPVYLMGHLHALWHAVLEQQEDGDLSSWTDESIADAAMFRGDAAKFVSLLLKHKWLDDARTVHDWLDYAGLYLTRKYSTRQKPILSEIWAKHGRTYGAREQQESDRRTAGEQQLLAPNQPNLTLPDQNTDPTPGAAQTNAKTRADSLGKNGVENSATRIAAAKTIERFRLDK